ncbi:putative immune-type receptor 14b isoform X1 [Silurus meridionalis]|nr:putative immune-type receptor 14b isoform X1 [Silurus meridionalis]
MAVLQPIRLTYYLLDSHQASERRPVTYCQAVPGDAGNDGTSVQCGSTLPPAHTVESGRHWVSAQSLTKSPVYQPDKELSVDIGDSATLRCCISETVASVIFWFKQLNRQKLQLMVTVYKTAGETFYNGFHKSRFRIKRFSNCFNTTILNTIQSDEAMYYCAVRYPNLAFADGTYLKIKVEPGRRWVSAQSLTETPVYQSDKELSVDIGDSATLRCCISETIAGIIFWFKQLNRQKPQLMVTVYKTTGETFYNGFRKSRFRIERYLNCFNTTILKTIQSDEAMYYCAVRSSILQFADGTYLKIKGRRWHRSGSLAWSHSLNGVVSLASYTSSSTGFRHHFNKFTDIVQPGRRRVSAQTLKDATVYQPDKELSVDIGDSATLRCCISTVGFGDIAWFKQPNREKPQIIVSFFRTAGETFYNGFEKSKFIIGRSSARNCFNLTILNTTPSDEAVYYCALTYPSPEFGDGTYLTIKGI